MSGTMSEHRELCFNQTGWSVRTRSPSDAISPALALLIYTRDSNFLYGYWVSEFMSSCFQSKKYPYWDIFQVQVLHLTSLKMVLSLMKHYFSLLLFFFIIYLFFIFLLDFSLITFQMLSPFCFPPKTPLYHPLLTNPPISTSLTRHSPILGHQTFIGPRVSPPIDVQQGHLLLHMWLEPCVSPGVLLGWWCSTW